MGLVCLIISREQVTHDFPLGSIRLKEAVKGTQDKAKKGIDTSKILKQVKVGVGDPQFGVSFWVDSIQDFCQGGLVTKI